MAALALAGIPWTRWARFIWPLQLAWLVAGLALLLVAHAIGWRLGLGGFLCSPAVSSSWASLGGC